MKALRNILLSTFGLALFLGMSTTTFGASDIALEIAVDSSKSMNQELDGETRMDIAKRVISETLADLDADISLRAFGHTIDDTPELKEQSCEDTELVVGFGKDFSEVSAATNALTPRGWTPLALTIKEAGEDLQAQSGKKPVLIILSDGEDTCGGDPEAEAAKLKELGIDVGLYIIGFAVDDDTKAILEGIADAGGGLYLEADDADSLNQSIVDIIDSEDIQAKTPEDVISTTGAENTAVGGSTYDDAKPFPRELLGKEFSLEHHLLKGAHDTFTLEVKAGQKLYTTIRTGEKAVKEIDGVLQVTDKGNPHAALEVFSEKKVKLGGTRVSGAFDESKDSISFDETGTAYIFIGPASNTSAHGTNMDTIYILDFEKQQPFLDVSFDDPYFDAISTIKEDGIVEGYADGTFGGNKDVNRAEFTKIILESTVGEGETIAGSDCFPDVKDEWFAPYVCYAKQKGIIDGYPDGTFKPSDPINFVEAAKIIIGSFGYETEAGGEWFRPFVNALSKRNAIPMTIMALDQKVSRAEMASMMFRLRGGIIDRESNNTL